MQDRPRIVEFRGNDVATGINLEFFQMPMPERVITYGIKGRFVEIIFVHRTGGLDGGLGEGKGRLLDEGNSRLQCRGEGIRVRGKKGIP